MLFLLYWLFLFREKSPFASTEQLHTAKLVVAIVRIMVE